MVHKKRKPRKAPGPAVSGVSRKRDDFTLPSALYIDAFLFYELARRGSRSRNLASKERYLRASLVAAFGFFEATINQAAFGHAKAHSKVIDPVVKDVLEEMETTTNDKGYIVRKTKFYSIETRFSLLALFLSGKEFDRSTKLWQDFITVKKLRDRWVHPKPPFDTWGLRLKDVKMTLVTLRAMMVELNNLMSIETPLWMEPWNIALAKVRGDEKTYKKWLEAEASIHKP